MLPRDTGNDLPLFGRDLWWYFHGLSRFAWMVWWRWIFAFCTGKVARCIMLEIDINGKEPNFQQRHRSRDYIEDLIQVSFALRVLLGHELCEDSTVFSALTEVPNILALRSY